MASAKSQPINANNVLIDIDAALDQFIAEIADMPTTEERFLCASPMTTNDVVAERDALIRRARGLKGK